MAEDIINTQTCPICKLVKPLSQFHRNASRKSGYRSDCKACVAAYQKWRDVHLKTGSNPHAFDNLPGEEWRDVVGREGRYRVSSRGRVASHSCRWLRLMRSPKNSYGYPCVTLYDRDKGGNKIGVHLLVAAAFIGPPPPSRQVNHIDGVKTNNHVGNLEYVTPQENTQHAILNGFRDNVPHPGESHPGAKLTNDRVRAIRASNESVSALAARYDVSVSLIYSVKHRKRWKHIA